MEKRITVTGVVQGVGFRPFVHGLATRLDLHGWVRNTSGGVEILVEGDKLQVESFIQNLQAEAPPLARIDAISIEAGPPNINLQTFNIKPSASIAGAFQPISVDVALCPDCERELFDPRDRRYLYPFINCTNCGPRFTIVKDIPYDRPNTTMAGFRMCRDCQAEYNDPRDRRFHAQPIACPECGPFVELRCYRTACKDERLDISEIEFRTAAILKTRRLLREGHIVAIKGLGGFHLACDAANQRAVNELRRRKGRSDKPFALMAAELRVVKSICEVSPLEEQVLTGHIKPIVLLTRKSLKPLEAFRLCEGIAPNLDALGVMLPYTPLHHLLLNQNDETLAKEPAPPLLVMTSGNHSEEPIATDNEAALDQLSALADAFLLHDRDIHIRCDDSVVRVESRRSKAGETFDPSMKSRQALQPATVYLRRSRGYAPYPVRLPFDTLPTLAVGGELKNAFCLARERYAFLSHHIGDMENVETYESFEQGVDHLSRLFRIAPEIVAYDMHPNYFTTRYARRPAANTHCIPIQHHHAHIAACMADNNLDDRRVIGLAFDGTGYGTDGKIWGGEILLASYADFERFAHLQYLPLPGGDSAIRHPWRIALGYAHALDIDIADLPFLRGIDRQAQDIVRQQVERELNTPSTSSLGRLFDAAASLIGIRTDVTYEAQAAIEMEASSKHFVANAEPYPHSIGETIFLKELLARLVQDVRAGKPAGLIGARFHKTIARIAIDVCIQARAKTGLNETALSGGVWQNQSLLNLVRDGLEKEEFVVFTHNQVPANDGGLALGQAVVANAVARKA